MVLRWISEGYQIPFHLPHSTSTLTQVSSASLTSERHTEVAPIARDSVSTCQEHSCSSPCLSTRPCIVLWVHVSSAKAKRDLSTDSQRLESECGHRLSTLKMETVQSVRASIHPSDWMFSIHLKYAYLHVPIHRGSFRYLRLAVSTMKVYHFRLYHSV